MNLLYQTKLNLLLSGCNSNRSTTHSFLNPPPKLIYSLTMKKCVEKPTNLHTDLFSIDVTPLFKAQIFSVINSLNQNLSS